MRLHMRFFHEALFRSMKVQEIINKSSLFVAIQIHLSSDDLLQALCITNLILQCPFQGLRIFLIKKYIYMFLKQFIVVLLCKSINSFVYYCTSSFLGSSSVARYFDSPRAKRACAKRRLTTDIQWRRVCPWLPAENLCLKRHRSPCTWDQLDY